MIGFVDPKNVEQWFYNHLPASLAKALRVVEGWYAAKKAKGTRWTKDLPAKLRNLWEKVRGHPKNRGQSSSIELGERLAGPATAGGLPQGGGEEAG